MQRYLFLIPVFAGLFTFWYHNRDTDDVQRVYYTWSGGTYCSHRELTSCGYTLSKCSDTMVYLCVTNLKYEDKNE